MPNLYTLTARIHKLLPQVNQKYGLEIEVESDFAWFSKNGVYKIHHKQYGLLVLVNHENVKLECLAIQATQIRQILVGLQDVLGVNPEYIEECGKWREQREIINNIKDFMREKDEFCKMYGIDAKLQTITKSQAEALCQKWLDGLEPLFDREPETVLQELIEVLENLLK